MYWNHWYNFRTCHSGSWACAASDSRGLSVSFDSIVWLNIWVLEKIRLYILPQQGRAVFVRLSEMIKHRERQTRTLFLLSNTTHGDMTYLLWQKSTTDMQVVKPETFEKEIHFRVCTTQDLSPSVFPSLATDRILISLSVYKRPFYEYMENIHLILWLG